MPLDLTFNIIFMPDTVPFLCTGVRSLLQNSPYRYRLVSNALQEPELSQLKAFAETDPRLEFYAYPTRLPVDHGTILTLLFHQQSDPYFCFADSDIFARRPFDAWLEDQMRELDALSSCSALFWEDMERVPGFSGRCTHSPAGTKLLSSFFAVYRRAAIEEVMQARGITFEKRMSPLHLSEYEREILDQEGWRGQMVDTAKLLNFELGRRGYRTDHQECADLLHIGGVSWWLWRAKGADKDMSSRPETITDADLAAEADGENLNKAQKRLKEARARWFSAYIYSLFGRAAEPENLITDPDRFAQVDDARQIIETAFGAREDWETTWDFAQAASLVERATK